MVYPKSAAHEEQLKSANHNWRQVLVHHALEHKIKISIYTD